jgi:streptogramin lyase
VAGPAAVAAVLRPAAAMAAGAGKVTLYPGIETSLGITVGPDGALWLTSTNPSSIGRITTSGTISTFTDPSIKDPIGITDGPDGALWFANSFGGSIGRITTKGNVSSFTAKGISQPQNITVGSDGALWFSNNNSSNQPIGRITTSGIVTPFNAGQSVDAGALTAGPDGALWFVAETSNLIGRITTAVTPQISDKSPESGPVGTQVTITGFNLGGATKVAFNGIPAPIISDTATTVVTQVPDGAATGLITITTPAGTASTKHNFVVTP